MPYDELPKGTEVFGSRTLRDLIREYPSIPWLESINIVLAPTTKITEDEMVIVVVPSFIPKLIALLKQSPKRVQANYLLWRTVRNFAPYLNKIIRNKELEFSYKTTGKFHLSDT